MLPCKYFAYKIKIHILFVSYFQERKVLHVFTTFSKEPFIKLGRDIDNLPAFKFSGINYSPDLVVIELESPFILGPNVSPACLPKSHVNAGATCYASGWGRTMPRKPADPPSGSTATELQAVKLKVLSSDQCETINNAFKLNVSRPDGLIERGKSTFLRNYEICVMGGDKGTCQGDSGGPVVCEGNFSDL